MSLQTLPTNFQNTLTMWEDNKVLKEIREAFAKNTTPTEFLMFVELGKQTGLNPFKREIWCVKYKGQAQIFVGRDGYRIGAQRHHDYEYHIVDAVYSNDKFGMANGQVLHQYDIQGRGKLLGAYAVVKRKSAAREMFVYVEFEEYKQPHGLWLTKPATMIKKVAEAQCLRMAFQDTFAGTYCPEEMPEDASRIPAEIPGVNTYQAETSITEDQVDRIDSLMFMTDMTAERLEAGINKFYRKKSVAELNHDEAEDFIKKMEKIAQVELSKKAIHDMENSQDSESPITSKNDATEDTIGS